MMDGGAVDEVTQEGEARGATPGVAYDPLADARSFAAPRAFLTEICAHSACPGQARISRLTARTPRPASPVPADFARVDLRCVEAIQGEGAVHLRYEVR